VHDGVELFGALTGAQYELFDLGVECGVGQEIDHSGEQRVVHGAEEYGASERADFTRSVVAGFGTFVTRVVVVTRAWHGARAVCAAGS